MVRAAAVIAATLLLLACEDPAEERAVDAEATQDTGAGGDPAITLVLVGDVGLNRNRAPVHADGFLVPRSDRVVGWQELTAGIAPLIDGDINFLNLETVVTDSNELPENKKSYNFRTHPDGVRHFVDIGFNLFSLANNHSFDYSVEGIRDTLRHVNGYKSNGLLGYAGLGMNRKEAAKPAVVRKRGASIALGAIGIGSRKFRAKKNQAGQLNPRYEADIAFAVGTLRGTDADFSILSIHEGAEYRVRVADP